MHDYNNNGISDKEDLIIIETDEENISNGANTAIPAIVVGIIVIVHLSTSTFRFTKIISCNLFQLLCYLCKWQIQI